MCLSDLFIPQEYHIFLTHRLSKTVSNTPAMVTMVAPRFQEVMPFKFFLRLTAPSPSCDATVYLTCRLTIKMRKHALASFHQLQITPPAHQELHLSRGIALVIQSCWCRCCWLVGLWNRYPIFLPSLCFFHSKADLFKRSSGIMPAMQTDLESVLLLWMGTHW